MYIIDADVRKEIKVQLKCWQERQEKIETNFKTLYNPMPPNKKSKERKPKQRADSSKELSCYAGSLTKEFFMKIRFISLYYSINFLLVFLVPYTLI